MSQKDKTSSHRGFIWSSRAWYHRRSENEQEINFGMYSGEGGTTGEMTMRWVDLGDEQVPQLRVFDDGWHALSLFDDLLKDLGEHDGQNITQEHFVEILLQCGFKDMTDYQSPYEPSQTKLHLELGKIEARREEILELLKE